MKILSIVLLVAGLYSLQQAMGGNWQVIPSGNGPKGINELHGVSAAAENDVWAVGA